MIRVLKQCRKEIEDFSEEIKGDIADAAARLDEGHTLSMPLSRPMPSIGRGVHELRFGDRAGIYRVIYALIGDEDIWFIHAFLKKTSQTPQESIDLAKKRLKEIPR